MSLLLIIAVATGGLGVYLLLPVRSAAEHPLARRIGAGLGGFSLVLLGVALSWNVDWPRRAPAVHMEADQVHAADGTRSVPATLGGWVSSVTFTIFAVASVVCAGLVVISKATRSAVIWFLLMLPVLGGLYLFLESPLLLFGQLLVFAALGGAAYRLCLFWTEPRRVGFAHPGAPGSQTSLVGEAHPTAAPAEPDGAGQATRRPTAQWADDELGSREPFAACFAGALLFVMLAGTIHYAFTVEARRTIAAEERRTPASPGASALPKYRAFLAATSAHPAQIGPASGDFQLLHHLLVVGAVLFALGTVGFVARRNLLVMTLSFALMLQGVTMSLAAFGTFHGNGSGELFALVALGTAAVQGALLLGVTVLFVRQENSLDISCWQDLRDPDLPPEETAPPCLEAAANTTAADRSVEFIPRGTEAAVMTIATIPEETG